MSVVVRGVVQLDQNVARGVGEHHASSDVTDAVVTEINGAEAIAVGVFHDQGVTAHGNATAAHVSGDIHRVVAAMHDGFAFAVFDAPADFVGPRVRVERHGPVVTLLRDDALDALVVFWKVVLDVAQQANFEIQFIGVCGKGQFRQHHLDTGSRFDAFFVNGLERAESVDRSGQFKSRHGLRAKVGHNH